MSEDDGEIEYLDEDEELVQKYVQSVPTAVLHEYNSNDDIEAQITPLLVERKPVELKRKKEKIEDDDSDYDPTEDLAIERGISAAALKKKRKVTVPKPTMPKPPKIVTNVKPLNITLIPQLQQEKPKAYKAVKKSTSATDFDVVQRKKLDIKIPDLEDPLCLPMRALRQDEFDKKRIRQWNNLCLEYFKRNDKPLEPEIGKTVLTSQTTVFRNVLNKLTKRIDTTIWSKTSVENSKGEKKSEVFQSFLPRYREKKIPTVTNKETGMSRAVKHKYEVILTKEEDKGAETLVAYNPKNAVSAVYKMIGKRNNEEDEDSDPDQESRALKEVTCCKICAPCYQVSWRGIVRKDQNGNDIVCKLCSRSFISVYNLLTHLKSHHSNADVRKLKSKIAKDLANVVGYHYKCRICQKQFLSIKELRKHVTEHTGSTVFKCEVGNHMAS